MMDTTMRRGYFPLRLTAGTRRDLHRFAAEHDGPPKYYHVDGTITITDSHLATEAGPHRDWSTHCTSMAQLRDALGY